MKTGILRTGFTINNHLYRVHIPAGVKVYADRGVVTFEGLDIQIFKVNGRFAASLWGRMVYLAPFEGKIPYPVVMIA